MKTWFLVLVLVVALIVIMTAAALAGPPAAVCDRLEDIGRIPDAVFNRICG